MAPVPRVGRILDLAGLLLFLAGGGVFVRSWLGFREVQSYRATLEEGLFATVRLADGYARLQTVGVALMVAGIAVFLLAWWVARRSATRSEAPAPAEPELPGPPG